jgi:hypothetical protein
MLWRQRTLIMRTYLVWIQPHPHGVILRHILNTVNSFLCSFSNCLENLLLPNDLIIVSNHGDDEGGVWNTKDVLESPRDVHSKVEIQTNSEFYSLTLSSTQSLRPPCIQIDAQDAYDLWFGHSTYAWKTNESPRIVKIRSVFRTFLLLRHLFWADGSCIEFDSTRDAS